MAQRVLITAGGSGIRKEIAKAYAAIGAKIYVCDIDAKALDTAVKDIPGVKTIVCDISKRHDIERMIVTLPKTAEARWKQKKIEHQVWQGATS